MHDFMALLPSLSSPADGRQQQLNPVGPCAYDLLDLFVFMSDRPWIVTHILKHHEALKEQRIVSTVRIHRGRPVQYNFIDLLVWGLSPTDMPLPTMSSGNVLLREGLIQAIMCQQ